MASMFRSSLRTALRPASASTSSALASTSKLRLPSLRFNSTSTTSTASLEAEAAPTEVQDGATAVRYSYFVPRVGKTLDSLPVYTDVRNGGTRTMTEVRKIQGSVQDLKLDLEVFLADTYAPTYPDSPLSVNKKPLRPKPGRKLVASVANPTYIQPVAQGKVTNAGKLKIRGNRVHEVKAFLESRGF
ncbi:uncharacterized protein PAN0_001c0092 [Moesziomyces antarcticus]|uniref:Large ribosomal subunit protein mL49 n=1 Tax=Pseudozyma antarctica TaxID=84753 RepID=A0A5C3FDH7_PSEA2|nr:uncharacterized protein PAN0_001c0092 [Moesziomyces antarcticus]GAK61897.1 hypothetical protein PAN0_001c0092 [Moesziomyces antarcticus]SPO42418.1 related to IMG2 - mitochondrial ribosomal protein of the large subunit [Moesziomyces antarcticus]